MTEQARALRRLAGLWGVQRSHVDGLKRRRRAPLGSLVAILRALGAPLERVTDAPAALRERRDELARHVVDPAAAAWDGAARVRVRLPAGRADVPLGCTLRLEDGEELGLHLDLRAAPAESAERIGRARYVTRLVPLDVELPPGYHRLSVEGAAREVLLISAPSTAFQASRRMWGAFLPTYAIRREGDWGIGDLTGLEELAEWTRALGADLVGTLPPLACFPENPSPYLPVSRRHWNEMLVDPERAPEVGRSREAGRLIERAGSELEELRRRRVVDHERVMAVKRPVLEELARTFFDAGPPEEFRRFSKEHDLETYARFRAACERHGAGWREWPEPGVLRVRDVGVLPGQYHGYVQWLAESQLAEIGGRAGLYLDMPLGVHPHGYDTWRDRGLYPNGISTGSPADDFSLEGQDWGFPPMHPERLRERGFEPLISAVRTLLRHARALRIDHVMALHRLFWIPDGFPATAGAYVRYPKEELYAILCLESHRRGAVLVGEDLGTVHPEVRAELRRRGLLRMFVTQTEVKPRRTPAVRPIPARAQASLNTHDMFPFRAFWEGNDIPTRVRVGILPAGMADAERSDRVATRNALTDHLRDLGHLARARPSYEEALDAALRHLAASPARLVLVNLEDLWGETDPQNIPGTTDEHPNWRRRARVPLPRARMREDILGRLEEVDRLRREGGS